MPSPVYHRLFIVTLVYLMVDKTHAQQDNVDYASTLMKAFIDLANNDLGAQAYQDYVNNNLTYKQQSANSAALVAQMAASLQSRLDDHTGIIRTLQSTIIKSLSSSAPDMTLQRCSSSSTVSGNADPNQVDLCVNGIEPPPIGFYSGVYNKMKENRNNVRRQYCGTKNGSLIGYPALPSSIPTTDPRLSSWYCSTISPFAKDVVILVQVSSSMSTTVNGDQSYLFYALNAINVILGGLNSRDRVAVVAFSNTVQTASADSCYGQELTVVNPTTVSQLTSFVNRLQHDDYEANYTLAYQTAYGLFNSSRSTSTEATKYRSIVLFAYGKNMKPYINGTLDAIRYGNRAYKNQVINFVYSFGPDTDGYLASIVNQINNDESVGNVMMPAVFQGLTPGVNWRTQLSLFFNRFMNTDSNAPVVYSVPYVDQTTNDLIMSLCLPVVMQTVLYGVACVDVTMDTLFSEVTYYQRSYLSYAFLLDGYGRLLIHPLLPRLKTFSPQTSLPYLTQIESGDNDNVATLQQSMISQTQGEMTFRARTILPRGDSELKGVRPTDTVHNYTWKQVANTNFSVCVVITEDYLDISLNWNSKAPPVNMMESVLDPSMYQDYCLRGDGNFTNVVMRNSSAVHVPPSMFTQPQEYLVSMTNSSFYSQLTTYLENGYDPPLNIKINNAPDIVASTYILEKHWQNHPAGYALNRYIGLREGIFRTFPGTILTKNYDPTRRSWYQQAVADQDSYALYGPYEDAMTGLCCVTIAKAIERQMSNSSVVIGVIALDFTVGYFQKFLADNFEPCSSHECFVMDESGFVIMHKNFTKPQAKCSDLTNQHVTTLESAIATDMINQGILQSDTCVSYVNNNRIKFWKVNPSITRTTSYVIHKIAAGRGETNVFVVVVDIYLVRQLSQGSCFSAARLKNDNVDGTCSQPTLSVSSQSQTCEYPCFMATKYDNVCHGQLSNSDFKPCIPPSVPLSVVTVSDSVYKPRLCYCNSTCITPVTPLLPPSTAQTTVAGPVIQHNLLPLIALAVIPVIIIVAVLIKYLRYCKRPKSTSPNELTVSPIYDLPELGADGYTSPSMTPSFTVDTKVYHPIIVRSNEYLRTSAVVAQPDGYGSDGERTSGGSSGKDSIGTQTERTPSSTSNVVGGITLV